MGDLHVLHRRALGLGVGLRRRLGGFLLGEDVVHLLFRLGHDMPGLLPELVGSANGATKRRFYGGAKLWQRFGSQHRGDADNHAWDQRGLEYRRTNADDADRRRRDREIVTTNGFGGCRFVVSIDDVHLPATPIALVVRILIARSVSLKKSTMTRAEWEWPASSSASASIWCGLCKLITG